ncbi:aminopeptidase [Halorussus salilacus]|uniref:aminopeptidase n=1 Tax=Halorussus salilacus TaxID=2953750 RepID=UPI00209D3496|nr:aminopeptidase [Halorussus salilacus]USZ66698.1 aminopeptidase [Halorussus salilacus]
MDPRIREHAETVVDHSTEVEPGDNVVISAPPAAEDLTLALSEVVGERGGFPLHVSYRKDATRAAFLRAVDPDGLDTPDHELALAEAADVWIHARAHDNVAEMSDVPGETMSAFQKAHLPIREEILDTTWVLTQFPAPADAQNAEMSTEEYEEFVWSAVGKDWEAQKEHQQRMVDILDAGEEVRIVSGDTTDLTMSVEGMTTINDHGKNNLPGGEVFTAPVADSVEGEVLFDKPLIHQGHEVEDAYLRFEGGEVVDHAASKNEEVLASVLDTDEGARRLGELGIGMNRDIDRFTYNMLFDEKMGDTVHLAVGRAYDECLPEGETGNESAVHVDMIVDMAEDSYIAVDGEIVQRNGTFRFEDGFEE